MKSSVRILLLITSILGLSACGSDDQHLPIIGTWEVTNDGITSYYTFSSDETLTYQMYVSEFECHSTKVFPLNAITNSSFTLDNGTTQNYIIEDTTLIINNDLVLTRSPSITEFISCADPLSSGSDDQHLPIIGTWEVTNDGITSYYTFSSDETLTYQIYVSEFECHSTKVFPLNAITNSSFTLDNGTTHNYIIEDTTLIINNDLVLTRSPSITEFISCADPLSSGALEVTVEFESLPASFTILEFTEDYLETFSVEISFDLIQEGSIGTRDFSIYANHVIKGSQSSTTVLMNELNSDSYFYAGGDRDVFISSAPYTIDNNAITFSFDRSSHKIFKEITNTSSINVSTGFTDVNGDYQSDAYPNDFTYTQGIELTNASDSIGDVSGNYSSDTVVDIKSVSVTVLE